MDEIKNYPDKFKDMDYEQAVGRLSELISALERADKPFDETLDIYKEAFEYYTYCADYLSGAAQKIKEMNAKLAGLCTKAGDSNEL